MEAAEGLTNPESKAVSYVVCVLSTRRNQWKLKRYENQWVVSAQEGYLIRITTVRGL